MLKEASFKRYAAPGMMRISATINPAKQVPVPTMKLPSLLL